MRKKGFLQGKGQPVRSPGSRLLAELKPKRSDEALFLRDPEIRIGAEFEFYPNRRRRWVSDIRDLSESKLKSILLAYYQVIASTEEGLIGEMLSRGPEFDFWSFYKDEVSYFPILGGDRLFSKDGGYDRAAYVQYFHFVQQFLQSKSKNLHDKLEPLGLYQVDDSSPAAKRYIQSYIERRGWPPAGPVFALPKELSEGLLTLSPIKPIVPEGYPATVVLVGPGRLLRDVQRFSGGRVKIHTPGEYNDLVEITLVRLMHSTSRTYWNTFKWATELAVEYGRDPLKGTSYSLLSGFEKPLPPAGVVNRKSWKVTTDRSLREGGVELISPPLPPDKFFKSLAVVFEHIRNYGFTDTTCGLHIGVSIPGIREVRLLKLLTLMEDRAFLPSFPDRIGIKWATEARKLLWTGLEEAVEELGIDEGEITGGSFPSIIRSLEQQFNRFAMTRWNPKELGINFTKLQSPTPYIEFRYLGGSGYENMESEVKRAILYYLKAISASLPGSTEGEREYERALMKFLEKRSLP